MTAAGQPSALEVPAGDKALSVGNVTSHFRGWSWITLRNRLIPLETVSGLSGGCPAGVSQDEHAGGQEGRQLRQAQQLLSNMQSSHALTGSSVGKEPTFNAGDQVRSLGREGPLRRKWQPAPVSLPGESHGQRSLVGYRPGACTSWT